MAAREKLRAACTEDAGARKQPASPDEFTARLSAAVDDSRAQAAQDAEERGQQCKA